MKSLKLIITNLILIVMLVILMGGIVYANGEPKFKIVPYFDENGNISSYKLEVEDGAFQNFAERIEIVERDSAGRSAQKDGFDTYWQGNIHQLQKTYDPNVEYTIICINSDGSKEYKVKTPNMKKIKMEQVDIDSDKAKIIFKKIDTAGNESVMKQADFLELGWKDVDFKNLVTNKIYRLDFSSWTLNNGGEASDDGTITLPEKGGYEVWTHFTGNGDNTYHRYVYAIDLSLFTAKLERENEYYTLNYQESLDNLIRANGGKNFKIAVLDMNENLIPNREVEATWHENGNPFRQIFGDDLPLYLDEYTTVQVRFHCDETGLDKTIELNVPKLDEISDVKARIIAPGKVELYSEKTGQIVKTSEIHKILGQEIDNKIDYKLIYESNGIHVIDNFGPLSGRTQASEILFEQIGDVPGKYMNISLDVLDAWELAELMNYIRGIKPFYDYYKIVKAEGDKELFVMVNDATGNEIDIPVEKPNLGEFSWFYGITGILPEEYDQIAAKIEEALRRHTTCVENGELELLADEQEKLFYVRDDGIYYIYLDDNSGISKIPYISIPFSSDSQETAIAYAGKLTGEVKDNKLIGQYVYYNANTGAVSFGSDSAQANCFPLIGGNIYKIKNFSNFGITVKFERLDINKDSSDYDLAEIVDQTSDDNMLLQSNTEGYKAVKAGYIFSESFNFFEALGSMLARFVRSLANGLNYLVQMALRAVSDGNVSSTVDIDKIIFNDYPDTSIAFFKSNSGGDSPSKMISMFRDAIDNWYSIFRAIAIAGYLIILLYIGVRILLSVGTQKQAKYKEMLTSWLVGIILLIFFPYVIKYAIEINNIFVAMIKEAKSGVLGIPDASSSVNMSNFSLPTAADEGNFDAFAQQMESNPFSNDDNSYMAAMAKKAHESGNLVDAVVYLIMVWQFIMIIILYYKRVFTVAFLIAIFPFVTLSYAIDKVGDGKAQAFNTWSKELVANIFIQTIHAIVYIFVIAATYTEGEYSGDWLLSIIGITFLFKGEEIFKKIIGQGSGDTVKSLGQTAQRTVTTIGAAKLVTKNVADNFIGATSHLGKSVNMYRQWRAEKKITKNMDFFTQPKPAVSAGNKLRTFNPALSGNMDYNQLADDIQTLNSEENVDPATYAKALDNILANRNNTDPEVQKLMKGLNLSDDQLNALAEMQRSVVDKLTDYEKRNSDDYSGWEKIKGDKRKDEKEYTALKESIDADIEAKLKIIIPGSDNDIMVQRSREFMKRAMYYRIRDGNKAEKHKYRETEILNVKSEITDAQNRRKSFFNPKLVARNGIGNPFSDNAKASDLSDKAVATRDSILSTYYGKNMSTATKEEIQMAENLAIMKDFSNLNHSTGRNAHRYTAKQVMRAARYVAKHENDSKGVSNAVKNTLGIRGEEARAIVAEEIGRRYTDVPGTNNYDFRSAVKDGVKAKVTMPKGATTIEKKMIMKNVTEALEMAIEDIQADDEKAGTKPCYDESVDGEVSVKDWLRKERDSGYSEDALAWAIIHERENRNDAEVTMVEDFAREQLDDLPEITNDVTFDGLTQAEHEKLAKDLKWKFVEELARAGGTTTTATLGAAIGAGFNIGLSDDKSAVSEALAGAATGIIAGDQLAETAIGRDDKVKKLKILNPYTREVEEFEVKLEGLTSDLKSWNELLDIDGPIRYDDNRLRSFNYNLDRQYLEHKRKKEKNLEAERKRNLFDEALRNSRNDS